MRNNPTALNIGMFSIGLRAYWSQMPGIREEILEYAGWIEEKLCEQGNVINGGMIDSVTGARELSGLFRRESVDIIFVHIGTYANSQTILHCLHGQHVPVVTLHLQPVDDFKGESHSGYTLPKNAFAAGGEIGNVLVRGNRPFYPVIGRLYGDDAVWREVKEWCRVARARKALSAANVGFLGSFCGGMCDLHNDMVQIISTFGINIELMEIAQLRDYINRVTEKELEEKRAEVRRAFIFLEGVTEEKLEWSIRVTVAAEHFVREHELTALTHNYFGYPGDIDEKIAYSLVLAGCMLMAKGIPCVMEGDILLTVPMMLMRLLSGGASQSEINVCDFNTDCFYVGHSGSGDITLACEKPLLRWLDFFHGRRGSGVSCEFSLRPGPVTLVSLVQDGSHGYRILCAQAEAIEGGRLKNGNVNTRIRFGRPVDEFFRLWMEQGPSHHSVISLGHHVSALEKFARIVGIQHITI